MTYTAAPTGIRTGLWVASMGKETVAPGSGSAAPASATLTTNRAYIVRIFIPTATVIRRFYWANGATASTNNVQVGVYNDDLTSFLLGTATLAAGATALQFDNVTDTPIPAGRYFLVLSVSGATTTLMRLNDFRLRGAAVYQQASAHPLPSPLVPAAAADGVVPLFGFTSIA